MPCRAKARTPHTTSKPAWVPWVDVQDCLCVICRQSGHLTKSCPQFPREPQDNELSTTPLTNKRFHILALGTHSSKHDQWMENVGWMTPIPLLGPVMSIQLLRAFCHLDTLPRKSLQEGIHTRPSCGGPNYGSALDSQ